VTLAEYGLVLENMGDIDDVLANLDAYREYRNFEFWWFPHTIPRW
jgi:hypothetical protein